MISSDFTEKWYWYVHIGKVFPYHSSYTVFKGESYKISLMIMMPVCGTLPVSSSFSALRNLFSKVF